jgi:hypothetical protein
MNPGAIIDKSDPNNYCIKATTDLSVGSLVLLEHVVSSSDYATIVMSVMGDHTMYNEFYPRNSDIDEELPTRQANAEKKTSFNVFGFEKNFVMGNVFSKFNHNCRPNCHMGIADDVKLRGYKNSVAVYAMWVHRAVKVGEELTIDYTNGKSSLHKTICCKFCINCNCTVAEMEKAEKCIDIHKKIDHAFSMKHKGLINDLVDLYTNNDGIHAIIKQELAYYGYFRLGKMILVSKLELVKDGEDALTKRVEQIENSFNGRR